MRSRDGGESGALLGSLQKEKCLTPYRTAFCRPRHGLGEKRMHTTQGYTSEFERYMNGFLEKHPDVVEDQKRGWYIWWDHRLDLDEQDKLKQSEVKPKPYSYE